MRVVDAVRVGEQHQLAQPRGDDPDEAAQRYFIEDLSLKATGVMQL